MVSVPFELTRSISFERASSKVNRCFWWRFCDNQPYWYGHQNTHFHFFVLSAEKHTKMKFRRNRKTQMKRLQSKWLSGILIWMFGWFWSISLFWLMLNLLNELYDTHLENVMINIDFWCGVKGIRLENGIISQFAHIGYRTHRQCNLYRLIGK